MQDVKHPLLHKLQHRVTYPIALLRFKISRWLDRRYGYYLGVPKGYYVREFDGAEELLPIPKRVRHCPCLDD